MDVSIFRYQNELCFSTPIKDTVRSTGRLDKTMVRLKDPHSESQIQSQTDGTTVRLKDPQSDFQNYSQNHRQADRTTDRLTEPQTY